MKTLIVPLIAAFAVTVAGSCTVNPATGHSEFTPMMTPSKELNVGAEEHPKILERYGGVYDNPEVSGYVARIGGRMAANSELPNLKFRITVLDSADVNAFALPGGYVYVTRGLLALANSEAELASVLAHEIGHVTARHTARRYNQAMGVALGGAILGALIGSSVVSDVVSQGGQLYLLSFSREQEFEADQLGVRYMTKAGYDPYAGADFLHAMGEYAALEDTLRGDEDNGKSDFLSTHPQTPKRVVEAIEQARATGLQIEARPRLRDEYLNVIDGMIYGGSHAHGFIRGQTFSHPKLGFTFTAPPGFHLVDRPTAVIAKGPGDAQVKFDMGRLKQNVSMVNYMTRVWAANAALDDVEPITVNGLEAATGVTRVNTKSGPALARLVTVRFHGDRVARFVMLLPDRAPAALIEGLQRMTYSFRELSPAEAARLKPLRVNVVRVRSGDTVESMAERMPFANYRLARLVTLNGLRPGEQVAVGARIKVIAE